jgi:hypothetical protein
VIARTKSPLAIAASVRAGRVEWLEARQAELLPVPYFRVVFTLPPAAAEIAFQNKQTVYGLLMRAAAEALMTLACRAPDLGGAKSSRRWTYPCAR